MIYLMRHGESLIDLQHNTSGLTARGVEQARRAGQWLHDKRIVRIVCGASRQAEQTARIMGDVLALQPQVDKRLSEIYMSKLPAQESEITQSRRDALCQRWRAGDLNAGFPDGENFHQVYARVSAILSTLPVQQAALLVTHNSLLQYIVPYLCVNAAALQRVNRVTHTGFVVLEPYDAGRYICCSWGLTEHLTV